jgi:glycyl-tRNA synthetase
MAEQNNLMDKIVALSKRRGFVYPSSEIYGGLANAYDYGPMGAELLRNIRNAWWKFFVHERPDMVGLDSSIILNPKVWQASGHVDGFSDAMVDCKICQLRIRADHLIEDYVDNFPSDTHAPEWKNIHTVALDHGFSEGEVKNLVQDHKVEGLSESQLDFIIAHFGILCPNSKAHPHDLRGKTDWTAVRKFNLLFETSIGIVPESESKAYLRGETAQGIFVSFKNVMDSTRVKLPFGIGQIGKSFRNEITKGNFIHRTLEFEQAEIEYFFDPEKTPWEPLFNDWKNAMWGFVSQVLEIKEDHLRWREHSDEERSFYSMRTEDLEYKFPYGFKELWGLAYRTDYDLKQHEQFSGVDLKVVDSATGRKFLPYVIEPALGVTRLFLMVMLESYHEEGEGENARVVLKFPKSLAPYRAAVFPLLANKIELVQKAEEVFKALSKDYSVVWDDRGNIGKRYRAQDEIGTPYCVTVDFQTLEDMTVTVRNRDTMQQERVLLHDLRTYLA